MDQQSVEQSRLPSWEKLQGRATCSIQEFLHITGWSRARYYRWRHKIARVTGYGVDMISMDEVRRIVSGEQPVGDSSND
jgi:hypothetical protein